MNGDDVLDRSARQRVRAALEQAADDIDPSASARLRDARRQAVAAAGRPRPPRWRWWVVGGVPAAAAVAMAVLVIEPLRPPPERQLATTPGVAARDLDLLTSGENLDLLEDLEFYRWLPAERSS